MHRYYHFYKPAGCVSACRDAEHQTVLDYFPPEQRPRLFPLGRLDRNTEGLLIITDDGKLNHRLLDPENHVEKQYLFWAAGELGPGELEQLRQGGPPEGTAPTHPAGGWEVLERASLRDISEPLFANRRHLREEAPETPAVGATCGSPRASGTR